MKDYLGVEIEEGDIIYCAQRHGNTAALVTRLVTAVEENVVKTTDPDTHRGQGRIQIGERCIVDVWRRS
jgi:hypothetical protein